MEILVSFAVTAGSRPGVTYTFTRGGKFTFTRISRKNIPSGRFLSYPYLTGRDIFKDRKGEEGIESVVNGEDTSLCTH